MQLLSISSLGNSLCSAVARWAVVAALAFGCGGGSAGPEPSAGPVHASGDPAHEDEAHGHGHGHEHGHEHGEAHHHEAQPLGHRFERAAEWVPRFDAPDRARWQKPEVVIAQMKLTPGMAVADVGAGTGYFLPYLSAAVGPRGTVLGVDIEPDMVRYIGERAARDKLSNVTARLAKPDDPALTDGEVDRVLLVNTWHHIPQRERYAARLARALRPGGAIYVVDYTMASERGPPVAHRLPPAKVVAELQAAGLRAEVRADVLPNQYIVIARPAK